MNSIYIFVNGKYSGFYNTSLSASLLISSIAINSGFEETELSAWSLPSTNIDTILSSIVAGEVLEISEGLFEVVNERLQAEIVTEYNDQDTQTENMAPPYERTVIRSYLLTKLS